MVELFESQNRVLAHVSTESKRFLYEKLPWDERAIKLAEQAKAHSFCRNKNRNQIEDINNAFLALDNIESGAFSSIPLGCLALFINPYRI